MPATAWPARQLDKGRRGFYRDRPSGHFVHQDRYSKESGAVTAVTAPEGDAARTYQQGRATSWIR